MAHTHSLWHKSAQRLASVSQPECVRSSFQPLWILPACPAVQALTSQQVPPQARIARASHALGQRLPASLPGPSHASVLNQTCNNAPRLGGFLPMYPPPFDNPINCTIVQGMCRISACKPPSAFSFHRQ